MTDTIKYFALIVLTLLLSTLNSSADIDYSSNQPHTPLLEAESFVSRNGIKTAGIYWLPDYLKDNLDRNASGSDAGSDSGDKNNACSDYGYQSNKPDQNIYDFTTKKNVTVDKSGNWITCYTDIKCKTKFQYTSTNCKEDNKPAGLSCGGKYETCQLLNCESGFTKRLTSCPNANGYTYTTGTPAGTVVCGKCTAKTCPAGSSATTTCDNINTKCTLTGYSGTSACHSSVNIPCPAGKTNCTYGCNKYDTSRLAMCGQICTECKTCTPSCTNQTSCSYGSYSVDNGCGGTCSKCYTDNCHNRTAVSCAAGCQSYFSDCPSKCQTCKPECNSSYIYNNDNCSGWRQPGGSYCGGYYNQCVSRGNYATACEPYASEAASKTFTVSTCQQFKDAVLEITKKYYNYDRGVTIFISGTISDCVNPFDEVLNSSQYETRFKFKIKGANSSARYTGVINLPDCTEISNLNIDGWLYFRGVNRIKNVTMTDGTRGQTPIEAKDASVEFTGNIRISGYNSYATIESGYGYGIPRFVFDNADAIITNPKNVAFQVTSYADRIEIKNGSYVKIAAPKYHDGTNFTVDSSSTLAVRGAAMRDVNVYGSYYYDNTGDLSSTSYLTPYVYAGGKYITNNLNGSLRGSSAENVYACQQNGAMLYGHAPGQLVGTYKCYSSNYAQKISDTPELGMLSW